MHGRSIAVVLLVIVFSLLPTAFGENSPFSSDDSGIANASVSVVIHYAQVMDGRPFVFNFGIQAPPDKPAAPLVHQLEKVRPGTWKTYFSFTAGFGSASRPPTDRDWERFRESVSNFAERLRVFQDAGYRILVYLGQRPRWLSACPNVTETYPNMLYGSKWPGCPPKDYKQWERLVEEFARIMAQHGIHPYYSVGNEPDWMMIGDETDYIRLYRYTAIGIKRGDPLAKVGGPCSSGFYTPKDIYSKETGKFLGRANRPLLEALIKEGGSTPVPELGVGRFPLDFVCWHFPTQDPKSSTFDREVEELHRWLADAGYPQTTPIIIGEWSYPTHGDAAASSIGASYVIAMVHKMADLGVSMQTHTSLYDQHGWSSGGWTHVGAFSYLDISEPNSNLRTLSYVVRPKFNAFVLLSMLGDTRVAMDFEDPYITASSWKGKGGELTVIFSNYIPPITHRLIAALHDDLSDDERDKVRLCVRRKLGLSGEDRIPLSRDLLPIFEGCLKRIVPDRAEEVKSSVEKVLRQYIDRKTSSVLIGLEVDEVPWSAANVEIYRIDRNHANACGYNKSTEPHPTDTFCGVNGKVDEAGYKAFRKALEDLKSELVRNGWSSEQAEAASGIMAARSKIMKKIYEIQMEMAKRYHGKVYNVMRHAAHVYSKARNREGSQAAWRECRKYLLENGFKEDQVSKFKKEAIDPVENLLKQADKYRQQMGDRAGDMKEIVEPLFHRLLSARMEETAEHLNGLPQVGVVSPADIKRVSVKDGNLTMSVIMNPYDVVLIKIYRGK